jgi:hypothetical protein
LILFLKERTRKIHGSYSPPAKKRCSRSTSEINKALMRQKKRERERVNNNNNNNNKCFKKEEKKKSLTQQNFMIQKKYERND